MVDFIQSWAEHVNQRNDLLPKWRERRLKVVVQVSIDSIHMVIDQTGVHFTTSKYEKGQLHLRSSIKTLKKLFSGHTKLTSLPNSEINIEGNYRHVLFMESLLRLSKQNSEAGIHYSRLQ